MHSKDHVELEVASARGKESSPVESRGGDVGGKWKDAEPSEDPSTRTRQVESARVELELWTDRKHKRTGLIPVK